MADQCIFCQIGRGETNTRFEYENEQIVVFSDIAPKAPLHLLVVPKKHIRSLAQLQDSDQVLAGQLLTTLAQIARHHKLDRSGFRVIINTGPDSGQEVDHLHLHLLGKTKLGPMTITANAV